MLATVRVTLYESGYEKCTLFGRCVQRNCGCMRTVMKEKGKEYHASVAAQVFGYKLSILLFKLKRRYDSSKLSKLEITPRPPVSYSCL